jgi:hypothetical protein
MTEDTFSILVTQVSRALEPLGSAVASPAQASQFLATLGWDLPPGVSDIGLAGTDLTALMNAALTLARSTDAEWAEPTLIAGRVANVVLKLGQVTHAVTSVMDGLGSLAGLPADYLAKTQLDTELLPRLLDFLIVVFLERYYYLPYQLLKLAGIISVESVAADPVTYQTGHTRRTLRFDLLSALLTPHGSWAQQVYGWGTPQQDIPTLMQNIGDVLTALGASPVAGLLARPLEEAVAGHPVPEADTAPMPSLTLTLLQGIAPDTYRMGVILFEMRPSTPTASDAGLALMPFIYGSTELTLPLPTPSGLWSALIDAAVDLTGGVDLSWRPNTPVQAQTGVFSGAGGPLASGSVGLFLQYAGSSTDTTLFTLPGGTSFSLRGLKVGGGVRLVPGGGIDAFAELDLQGGKLTLSLGAADSFIGSLIPVDPLVVTAQLSMLYSQRNGLSLSGAAGLKTAIPIGAQVGPFRIDTLHVAASVSATGLAIEASLDGSGSLGPVIVSVQRIGTDLNLNFQNGNLGPVDFEFGFRPPDGVGLAIDAGPVSGGGFLSNDPATGRYAGALELRMESLALKAIGLLDTRLPDGSAGYSLIVIITAEFEAIQLGFGFTLTGVGGLAGINRTVVIDALRAGVRAHRLDNILFPPDPIGQAGQILSDMAAIFPPDSGNYVFGPMVKLGWGTPEVLTLELGLLLELPPPLRLIVLGRIALNLPDPDAPLVRIQMDSLGVVDFGTGQVAVDAVLFDSNIAGFALTGSMALRAAWLGQPGFALAIGGFNPGFTPPAQFPVLDRVTIALASGNNPRLRLSAYLALTSNTAQIGARLDLFVQGPFGITLQGELSFDALFQFSPFQFVVGIGGSVTIMSNGQPLLSAAVQVTLTGPNGWHVQGQASFSLFGFSVSVSFDTTIGSAQPLPAPPPVQLAPLLEAALTDPANWAAALPADASTLLTFSAAPVAGKAPAHPLAGLAVHQAVLPLDIAIQRYGSATPADPGSFSITSVTIGTAQAAALSTLDDWFAPGQFLQLSDADSLQRPSFEQLHAGVAVTTPPFVHDTAPPPAVPAQYRTMVYDTLGGPPREVVLPGPASTPAVAALTPALTSGRSAATAAAPVVATAQGSPAASRGRARFLAPGLPLQLIGPRYALATTATLAAVGAMPPPGAPSSWTATAQNLARYLAANPGQAGQVQLVAGYEVR